MKKFSLLLTGLLLPLLANAAVQETPYASTMTDWTVTNVNEDEKTWAPDNSAYSWSGTGYTTGMKYSYNSKSSANDWMVSPDPIHLEAGTEYKVKFWYKSSGTYGESFALYYSESNDLESLKNDVKVVEFVDVKESSFKQNLSIFTPEVSGDYYFGFYCFSDPDKMSLYLTGLQIAENVFAPAAPTALTVTAGENKAVSATLTWKLPTTDSDGVALTEEQTIQSVSVYRDGELIATLDGAVTEFTDTEATGLTPGIHTYGVSVKIDDRSSARETVTSPYIGPLQPQAVPWNGHINTLTDENFSLYFTVFNTENSASTSPSSYYPERQFWYLSGSSNSKYLYNYPQKAKKDDWVVSPPLAITEPGIYRVSTNLKSTTSDQTTNTNFYLGSGYDAAAYTAANLIGTAHATNQAVVTSKGQNFYFFTNVAVAGSYNIAVQELDENGILNAGAYLYELAIEPWYESPSAVTDINTEVNGEEVTLIWTNPLKSNIGSDITSLSKIEIFCDGSETPSAVLTDAQYLVPGANLSYTFNPGKTGIVGITIVPYMGEYASDQTPVTVYTKWIGDDTQTLPYTFDFKDERLFSLWETIGSAEDTHEWILSTNGAVLNTYQSNGLSNINETLVSAPFDITPGYYTATISAKGGAYNRKLKIGFVSKSAENPEWIASKEISLESTNYAKSYNVMIQVEEAGKYNLAIQYDGDGSTSLSMGDLTITKVELVYNPLLPGVVTDLAVTAGADMAHTATLTWKYPTTSSIQNVAPVMTKAEVYRRGVTVLTDYVLVGTLTDGLEPGAEATFEDTDIPGSGIFRYKVEVYGPEGTSTATAPTVMTTWIGSGIDLPYEPEGFNDFTVFNIDNDKNNWGEELTWKPNSANAQITVTSKAANDWMISVPLNFPADYTYEVEVLSFLAAYGNPEPSSYELYLGKGGQPEDMTILLGTVNVDETYANAVPSQFFFKAVAPAAAVSDQDGENGGTEEETEPSTMPELEAGIGYVGFYANQKGEFTVRDFKVKSLTTGVETIENETIYTIIDNLVAIPADAADIVVFDMTGAKIRAAANASELKIADLASGIYMITCKSAEKRFAVKVIK